MCGIVGFVGLLLYSVLYLGNVLAEYFLGLKYLAAYFPYFSLLALVVLVSLLVFTLARLFRGNDSHGIIDDGTGVAILLELARFIHNHDFPGTRFTFGFFGSEESGLIGSAYYYLNRDTDKNKLRVISIDMIGEKQPLSYVKGIYPLRKRRMDPGFNEQMESIAQDLDIEIKGKNFPYPGSDFGHFLLDGDCKTNWLINDSKKIHSKHDNLSNLKETLVIDALKLMVGWLLEEEERFYSHKSPAPDKAGTNLPG